MKAAAAKAAACMLLGGRRTEKVKIDTPAGICYMAAIEDIRMEDGQVRCAVRKDSGDDPDITNGILIFATVERIAEGVEIGDRVPDDAGIVGAEGGEPGVVRFGHDVAAVCIRHARPEAAVEVDPALVSHNQDITLAHNAFQLRYDGFARFNEPCPIRYLLVCAIGGREIHDHKPHRHRLKNGSLT